MQLYQTFHSKFDKLFRKYEKQVLHSIPPDLNQTDAWKEIQT